MVTALVSLVAPLILYGESLRNKRWISILPEDVMSQKIPPENGVPNNDDLLGDEPSYDRLLESDELPDDDTLVEQLLSNDELLESSIQAYHEGQISVADLLEQLISAPEDPDVHVLMALSDLSRADAALIRNMWPSIPAERRQLVVTELVDFAEHDCSLHLIRFLQLMLDDEDAAVREAATNGLAHDITPELVTDLVQLLKRDSVVGVRAAAAHALGAYILAGELEELDSSYAMRAEQALLSIIHNLQEPVEIRSKALESISFSGEVGVRQLIEDAYYSADKSMRVSSLVSMGRSADVRWRGLVRAELQNPSREMRTQAAIASGELESQSALNDLLMLLEDRVPSVRLAAIFALGRIGGKAATNAVSMIVANEDAPAEEIEAAKFALEEMPFVTTDGISAFDEDLAVDDEWEIEPWDAWDDDIDLGLYEDDDDYE